MQLINRSMLFALHKMSCHWAEYYIISGTTLYMYVCVCVCVCICKMGQFFPMTPHHFYETFYKASSHRNSRTKRIIIFHAIWRCDITTFKIPFALMCTLDHLLLYTAPFKFSLWHLHHQPRYQHQLHTQATNLYTVHFQFLVFLD